MAAITLLHHTPGPVEATALARAEELLAPVADRLHAAVLTPDAHTGHPAPVGLVADLEDTVLVDAIGSDIGCGIALLALRNVAEADLADHREALRRTLRHRLFEGGRDLPSTARARAELLTNGPAAFAAALDRSGDWRALPDPAVIAERTHPPGMAGEATAFARWAQRDGRDDQLGTVGGGNHFCELGVVDGVDDGATLRAFGLAPGDVIALVHTGSLGFGRLAAALARDRAREADALQGRRTALVLDADDHLGAAYLAAHAACCHFALANRLAIACAVREAVAAATAREDVGLTLITDTPHNFIAREDGVLRHRKGASPALGPAGAEWTGRPVAIAGSMGEPSALAAGLGSDEGLSSAPHGAGRALSRGAAAALARRDAARHETSALDVVLPIDRGRLAAAGRPDLANELDARLAEESPGAYKRLDGVLHEAAAHGLVRPVARLRPLITAKGR